MDKIHKFEEAGLGSAPYKYIGYKELKYQACEGAPIQPGGSCDYCGTAIVDAYYFLSADKNKFKVGSDCVKKAGDRGMIDLIKRAANKVATQKRHGREAEKIATIKELVADPTIRSKLATQPHPAAIDAQGAHPYYSKSNLLEYVDWMMKHSGNTGKLKIGKIIEKLK